MTGPPATTDNTWGAAFIGLLAACVLYGMTTLQLLVWLQLSMLKFHHRDLPHLYRYIYYILYPKDSFLMKILATSVWVVDTISLVLVANTMYGYLISDMFNPLARIKINRNLEADPALMGLLALLTHGYLGTRVWKVCNRNVWLGLVLVTLSVSAFTLAIVTVIISFRFELWTEKQKIKWLGLAGTVLVVALDSIIALVLCVYLLKQRVVGKGTKRIIRRVLIFALNTGLVSTVMSTVSIVTFFVSPNTMIFLGTNFLFTKVYANALLANLNARESLRGRGYINDATLSLNLSALRTKPSEIVFIQPQEDSITDLEEGRPHPQRQGASRTNHAFVTHLDADSFTNVTDSERKMTTTSSTPDRRSPQIQVLTTDSRCQEQIQSVTIPETQGC